MTHFPFLKPKRRGMTFIEVMTVISVLAILAALVFPRFQYLQGSADAIAAGTPMVAIANTLRDYHAFHGDWPAD